ncbi:MAG: type II toxin-antitoxin system VapC family toxin [Alphaproteobacteria bacterium]|nr:type II toxin-antitoxin system VapC family toxin [Alphaproteobacteria bacterium]
MIALDTNVVIRFLVNDDKAQGRRARDLIAHGGTFVGPTVLLEAEWVLRSAYGFPPAEIRRFFRAFLGLPGMSTEEPGRIARALDAYAAGLDFADALHLSFAGAADSFASFDARLARRARRLGIADVKAP